MISRTLTCLALFPLGLAVAGGCKSSQPRGLAENGSPDPASEIRIATTETALARNESLADARAASPTSSWAQKLQQATWWLPLGRSRNDDTTPLAARAGESAPAGQKTPSRTEESGDPNTTAQRAAGPAQPPSAARGGLQPSGPAATATFTPSLVRHARRPPPDPAPKPFQEEAPLAEKVSQRPPGIEVSAKTGETTAQPPVSLPRIISVASAAWRVGMSHPSASHVATGGAMAQGADRPSELKFSPPNIERQRSGTREPAASTSAPTDPVNQVAHKSDPPEVAARQAAPTEKDHAGKSPRREQLLAKAASVSRAKKTSQNDADGSHTAQVPRTVWASKQTVAAAPQSPRPGGPTASVPAAVASTPATPTSVVADTFAQVLPAQQPPTKSASPQPVSEFPLSARQPTASDGSTPQFVTNPHVRENPEATAATATPPPTQQPTGTAPSLRTGADEPDTTAVAPTRVAQEPLRVPKAANTAVPAAKPRSRDWQQPLPYASSSYQSYYQRGVLPGSGLLTAPPTRRPISPGPATVQTPVPSDNQLAPLVDAADYRRPLAEPRPSAYGPSGTTAPPLTPGATAPGSWLSAYQELLRSAKDPQQEQTAPEDGTTRNLRSDP